MRAMRFVKSRTLLNYFKSFFVIIALLVALTAALTTWVIREFTAEIVRTNYDLTTVVQNTVDLRFDQIEKTSQQIQLDPVHLLLSNSMGVEGVKASAIHQLYTQMKNYKAVNRFIHSGYIYYPALDLVIGDLGYFSTKEYYLLYNELDGGGYEQWLAAIRTERPQDFYLNQAGKEPRLCYSRRVPDHQGGTAGAVIVFEIEQSEILGSLYTPTGQQFQPWMAVASAQGEVFARSWGEGGEALPEGILQTCLQRDGSFEYNQYFVIAQTSAKNQLKYITLVDKDKTLKLTHLIWTITAVSLAALLLLGLGLAGYLSMKNSRPLLRLLNKMPQKAGAPGGMVDEFDVIGGSIDEMLDQNVKSQKLLETQQTKIEQLFLTNLLSEEQHSDRELQNMLLRYDVAFEFSLFQAFVLRFAGAAPEREEREFVAQSLLEAGGECYMISVEYKGDLVFLCNLEAEHQAALINRLANARKTFAKNGIHFNLGAGRGYDALSGAALSYNQALKALEKNAQGAEGVFVYRRDGAFALPSADPGRVYMRQFQYAMLEEDYGAAMALADPLFERYLAGPPQDYLTRCKKYAVTNLLLEAVNRAGESIRQEYCFDLIVAAKGAEKLRESCLLVLEELARGQQVQPPRAEKGAQLAQKAGQLIEQNFCDPAMGLYWLSERLGVSNTYLSTTFKAHWGQGILTYLNKLRVEKAKQLLGTTDLTIKDIALKVGFAGDTSFIRVFKKYEKVSPGKFREQAEGINNFSGTS